MFTLLRRRLASRSAISSAFIVTVGTVAGQAVLLAITPFITRLYSPHEMGLYSLFIACVGIFSVTVSLHYELAVPLPKYEGIAKQVGYLAFWVAVGLSIAVGGTFFLFRRAVFTSLDAPELANIAWCITPVLFLTGLVSILSIWCLRVKEFPTTAVSKVMQGGTQSVSQLALGMISPTVGSMIAGQIIGLCSCAMVLSRTLPSNVAGDLFLRGRRRRLGAVARRYRGFPQYSTFSSLINAASAHLPVMLLSVLYGAEVTGLFALSYRVLQVPLRLVGQSISQVLLSRAAEMARGGTLGRTTGPLLVFLWSAAFPIFLIGGIIAPALFALAFGEPWREAGMYARYLMPWMLALFVSSIMSVLIGVVGRQKEELRLNVVYLTLVLTSLSVGAVVRSPTSSMIGLGFVGLIFMIGKCVWILNISGAEIFSSIRRCVVETLFSAWLPVLAIVLWYKEPSDGVTVAVGVAAAAAAMAITYSRRDMFLSELKATP